MSFLALILDFIAKIAAAFFGAKFDKDAAAADAVNQAARDTDETTIEIANKRAEVAGRDHDDQSIADSLRRKAQKRRDGDSAG